MKALDRKLWRDLLANRGPVLTIAVVVAAGVCAYAALFSVWQSLQGSQEVYYEQSRFPDVFAHVKRAPDALLERIERIPGAAQAEVRETEAIALDLPDLAEPALGLLISLPEHGPRLSALYLRSGRSPEPGRSEEVLVNEAFAQKRRLRPGDSVTGVINGRRAELRITGIALSPEHIFAIAPGGMGEDESRFGIFWMERRALAQAFRMEGAFNDVAVKLSPGIAWEGVVDALDRILAPYGCTGAYDRSRQPSHRIVASEISQLKVEATISPIAFLAVAAFLVNVVLSRLIGTQREQIAALKAVGYTDREVALHYLKFVLVVLLLGAGAGLLLGATLGRAMMGLYQDVFRFPSLNYALDLRASATGLLVATVAAVGSLFAVRQAARLPPAEAMRPPAPPVYRKLLVDRLGWQRAISQGARMILRDLERAPLRLAFSALGVAAAIAILISGRFAFDTLDWLLETHFGRIQREDLVVSFLNPAAPDAIADLAAVPGVLRVEPLRMVPARLRLGHISYETAIQGVPPRSDFRRALDPQFRAAVPAPPQGMLACEELLRRLRARVGDEVQVEALDGTGRGFKTRIAGTHAQVLGLMPIMSIDALGTLLGDIGAPTGAALSIDAAQAKAISVRLKDMPRVSGATRLAEVRRQFAERQTEFLATFTAILAAFAAAIAVGVVYNNARVALAVRSRDLATLRVLGYTRAEISALLLGELSAGVLLALPAGLLFGKWLSEWIAGSFDAELYKLPAIIAPQNMAFAVLVVLGAALASALLVRRKLDHLDLLSVLKARE